MSAPRLGLATALASGIGLLALFACAVAPSGSGSGLSLARQRTVPVTIPIGCLMIPGCFESPGIEGARQSSQVSLSEIKERPITPDLVTSSDPVVSGTDAAETSRLGQAILEAVRAELRQMSREQLLARGPMPQGQGILGPIPEALQASLAEYAKGEDFFACMLVFAAMRRATADIADELELAKTLEDLYPRYLHACHQGSLESLGAARDRVVVLLRKDMRGDYYSYCMGFNVAANYILTAHHCLVEGRSIELVRSRFKPTDPDAYIPRDGPLPQSRALVIGEPDKLFELRAPENVKQDLNFYPFEPERDAVILELIAPERAARIKAFPIGDAAQWDSLRFAALFVEDKALSAAIATGQGEAITRAIADGSAVDISPLCSLVFSTKTAKPFLFHGCQTRYGYSGSPILRRGIYGEMVLVGVHTGSVDPASPVDAWPYAVLFPNYGLRLPELVRTLN